MGEARVEATAVLLQEATSLCPPSRGGLLRLLLLLLLLLLLRLLLGLAIARITLRQTRGCIPRLSLRGAALLALLARGA